MTYPNTIKSAKKPHILRPEFGKKYDQKKVRNTEADVLVLHEFQVLDQENELANELLVLVDFLGQRVGPGQRRLDVGVPEGTDKLLHDGFVAAPDSFPCLPYKVPHQNRDVDRILGRTFAEVAYEPLARLIVNEDIEVAYPDTPQTSFKRLEFRCCHTEERTTR